MKITISYWENPNGYKGYPTINCRKIEEVITGKNAKECMEQIEQKRANHDCWKNSPMQIVNVED